MLPDIPQLHLFNLKPNVVNVSDAKGIFQMGVSRIIVAREISLNDCRAIRRSFQSLS